MGQFAFDARSFRTQSPFEQIRHLVLCAALFVLPFQWKLVSYAISLGALLGIFYLIYNRKNIIWRDLWPLAILPGYYLLDLFFTPFSTYPQISLEGLFFRILYLLTPFCIVGLKPRKMWGTAFLIGTGMMFLSCFILTIIRNTSVSNGQIIFQLVSPSSYSLKELEAPISHFIQARRTVFNYLDFSENIGGWPTWFGMFYVFSLVIFYYRFKRSNQKRVRNFCLIAIFCLLFLIIMGDSRTSMISVILSIAFILAISLKKVRINWWWKVIILFSILGTIPFIFFSRYAKPNLEQPKDEIFEYLMVREARLPIWYYGLRPTEDYWPWGVGPMGVEPYLRMHLSYPYRIRKMREFPVQKMHNEWFEALIEKGILGFLSVCAIVLLPFFYSKRVGKEGLVIVIVLATHMMFDSVSMMLESIAACALLYSIIWQRAIIFRQEKNTRVELSDYNNLPAI